MIEMLYEDPFFRVEHNPSDRLVRLARTERPFEDLDTCARAYTTLDARLAKPPAQARLLVDLRDAPARNDPGFEATVRGPVERIVARFPRVAFLAKTAAGKLQIRRMTAGMPKTVAVFDDEDGAFEHLLG